MRLGTVVLNQGEVEEGLCRGLDVVDVVEGFPYVRHAFGPLHNPMVPEWFGEEGGHMAHERLAVLHSCCCRHVGFIFESEVFLGWVPLQCQEWREDGVPLGVYYEGVLPML